MATITAFNGDTGNTAPTNTPTNTPVAVQTFSNTAFGNVRIVQDEKGEPWFVVKDVLQALEYAKTSKPARLIQAVPAEWKGMHPFHTRGGKQQLTTLSEQGLYFFLARSDKPRALPFQRWMAGEVLPAIRRHGGYLSPDKLAEALLSPDTLIQLAHNLKAAQEKAAAEERLRLEVEEKLEEAQPKAETYDKVVAPSRLSVTQFARRLHGVNINAVKRSLMEAGYLYKPDHVTYRVYSRYRDVFFAEKYDREYGFHHIIALPAGQQLMVHLYNSGRLIMRRGFDHAE